MFKISFLFILFIFTFIGVYLSNRFSIKLIGKYSLEQWVIDVFKL